MLKIHNISSYIPKKIFIFSTLLIYYFFSFLLGHNLGYVQPSPGHKRNWVITILIGSNSIESKPNRHRCGIEIKNTSQGMYKMKIIKESEITKLISIYNLEQNGIILQDFGFLHQFSSEFTAMTISYQTQTCSWKIW
jgi:hypothetical protein